ncbi:MAG: DUF4440 domain-containing protein [Bacteroidales bacterium]|nr:DUF4440 domain-containing protein [Bacteroidales bacterium]
MKNLFFSVFAVLIGGLILNSCNPPVPVDVADDIIEANKAFMEDFNNGDMKAVAQHYTENAKLFPSNSEIIQGREAIEEVWNGAKEMGVQKSFLETVTANSFGNTAIEEGKYTLYAEGDIMIDKGKYIVIWKKEDGKWLLDLDIWNTSIPLPTPDPEPETE